MFAVSIILAGEQMVQAKSEKDEFSAQGNSSSFESSGSIDDNLEFIDDPIQLYLKDIAQTRLLDAKDEFHLAVMIQARQ